MSQSQVEVRHHVPKPGGSASPCPKARWKCVQGGAERPRVRWGAIAPLRLGWAPQALSKRTNRRLADKPVLPCMVAHAHAGEHQRCCSKPQTHAHPTLYRACAARSCNPLPRHATPRHRHQHPQAPVADRHLPPPCG